MIHFLHGNAGLPDDLMPLVLATGQPFHAWHLWRTLTDHPVANSFDGFARFLNDTAVSDTHRPRVLLGYSLGARLALHALTNQPQLWDAAILISAHPGLRTDKERAVRLTQDHAWSVSFLRDPWPDVMAEWNAQPVFRSSTFQCRVERADGALDFGKSSYLESWRREIAHACDVWSLARQADLRPRLPSVQCPVLWITGERDKKFTALAADACTLLPHASHVIMPESGHRVHLDQPAAVAAEITGFLSGSAFAQSFEAAKPVASPLRSS